MAATMMEKVGGWSFIIGFLVALILGVMGTRSVGVVYALLVLGLIIGLLNISDREIVPFLVATIALVVAGSAVTGIVEVPDAVKRVLVNITIFVVTLCHEFLLAPFSYRSFLLYFLCYEKVLIVSIKIQKAFHNLYDSSNQE